MKEHPRYSEILSFFCVRAYTRRRDSKGVQPLGTQTLAESLVCYTSPEMYRLSVRTYAAIAPNANLILQNKRQDNTAMVIPCLCSFLLTVPSSAFSEPPVNKKRTRTLFYKESGSSTNCLVDGTGLEPVTSCTSSRCSTS